MEKVSVIVPVFNSSRTLERCIQSILGQSYRNLELILVNDGSDDNSLDICQSYKKLDKRVIVIDKMNAGVSEARNDGIKKSSGDYIMFVDSDDYLSTCTISSLINYKQYDCAIFGYNIIKGNKTRTVVPNFNIYNNSDEFSNDFSKLYFQNLINSPCNKLYKKKLITSFFPKDINMGEDLIFNLNYLENCCSIICLDLSLYNYVIFNANSLSQKHNSNAIDNSAFLYNEVLNFCNKKFKTYSVLEINNKYLEDCFSNVQKLVFCKGLKKTECIEVMKYILSLNETQKALKNYLFDNWQYKYFSRLLTRNKLSVIYYYFFIKGKVKQIL